MPSSVAGSGADRRSPVRRRAARAPGPFYRLELDRPGFPRRRRIRGVRDAPSNPAARTEVSAPLSANATVPAKSSTSNSGTGVVMCPGRPLPACPGGQQQAHPTGGSFRGDAVLALAGLRGDPAGRRSSKAGRVFVHKSMQLPVSRPGHGSSWRRRVGRPGRSIMPVWHPFDRFVGLAPSLYNRWMAALRSARMSLMTWRRRAKVRRGRRLQVDIALKALSCHKRPDDAVGCLDDRRSAAFGQPAPAAGLRIQQRTAPALARRRERRRTGDPYCRTRATTGRGPVVGAASDLAADLPPDRARDASSTTSHTCTPASRRSSQSAILQAAFGEASATVPSGW